MDRATLLHVKSTMDTAQQVQLPGNERRSIANCYADREMLVITGYYHIFERMNAQTPLNRYTMQQNLQQIQIQIEPMELRPMPFMWPRAP